MSIIPNNHQATVTITEITDPSCASEGTELMNFDVVNFQESPFRARRIIVNTKDAAVLFGSTNNRLRTRTTTGKGKIAYAIAGPRAQGTVNGIQVRPGFMLTMAPEVEYNLVVNAEWETLTFLLAPDLVHAHLAARQRESEYRQPQGVEMLEVSTSSALKLFDWGKQLVETAAEHMSTFNAFTDGLPAIQCNLIENLLATLDTSQQYTPSASERTKQKRNHIVKIAEDYALSQNGSNVYVSDLCRVTCVSERTLTYAFKEVMGMAPLAFLNRLRLHRVRRELLAANPGSTTVAKEALRWGFFHFGEFAQNYYKCFDERPSDTLMRPKSQDV